MWVNNALNIDNKRYIINDLSIIVFTKSNNIEKVLKIEEGTFIDFGYNQFKNELIILTGIYDKNKYNIITTNMDLVIKNTFKIDMYPLIPTDIIINKGR